MRLPALFFLAVLLNFNVISGNKSDDKNIIIKDEIISKSDAFNKADKTIIWECDFTDVSIWDSHNFLGANSDVTDVLVIGDQRIRFCEKMKYGDFSGRCIVSTDFDPETNQNSVLETKTPISISGYDKIELSFSQVYRSINNSKSFIEISTNGETWERIEVNAKVSEDLEAVNKVIIDISDFTQGQVNLWIRFITDSNNLSWIIDNIELQGITLLLPEILTLNPNQASQGESLTIALSGQSTNFTQGSQTVWFQQASQTIISGTNIIVYGLTQLDFNVSIPINAPTGFYDVKAYNNTDGTITKPGGFEVLTAPSPNWSYTSTGIDHTIVIPSFATITIDGVQISNGDYIGVFYDSLGTLACGGYVGWYGNTTVLHAWGNDPFTTEKDGFNISEEFVWKIWDASSTTEYIANANYQISGFPNIGFYVMNGSSGITSINALSSQTQTINLAQGWDIYSTYINPSNPSMSDVFSSVINNILLVKNGMGQVFWPPYVNQIGSIVVGEGYQINMSLQSTLEITGIAVSPETTPVNIPLGWSIIGYLRQSPANAVTMMAPIFGSVVIVKDGWGAVYWPAWGINNIGNFVPGEGYQIRTSAAATLYYPANTQSLKTNTYSSSYPQTYYIKPNNTGNNMTLCIPLTAWDILPLPGDEIGIFNLDGTLSGCGVFENENLAITIWGDDDFTKDNIEYLGENEKFEIRLYSQTIGSESLLNVSSWNSGDELFNKDKLTVIEKINEKGIVNLYQSIPNPCSSYTKISFDLIETNDVTLNIYNVLGELVIQVESSVLPSGFHSYMIDVTKFNVGTYFYKLTSGELVISKQFIVLR